MKEIFEVVQKLGPDHIRTETADNVKELPQLDEDKERWKNPKAEVAGSKTTKHDGAPQDSQPDGVVPNKRNWRLKGGGQLNLILLRLLLPRMIRWANLPWMRMGRL